MLESMREWYRSIGLPKMAAIDEPTTELIESDHDNESSNPFIAGTAEFIDTLPKLD